jgi:hypothetical protein
MPRTSKGWQMSREQLIADAIPFSPPAARQGRAPARSKRAKLIAVEKAPRADLRDACGLKWQFSCNGWPFVVRLLCWALRGSQV